MSSPTSTRVSRLRWSCPRTRRRRWRCGCDGSASPSPPARASDGPTHRSCSSRRMRCRWTKPWREPIPRSRDRRLAIVAGGDRRPVSTRRLGDRRRRPVQPAGSRCGGVSPAAAPSISTPVWSVPRWCCRRRTLRRAPGCRTCTRRFWMGWWRPAVTWAWTPSVTPAPYGSAGARSQGSLPTETGRPPWCMEPCWSTLTWTHWWPASPGREAGSWAERRDPRPAVPTGWSTSAARRSRPKRPSWGRSPRPCRSCTSSSSPGWPPWRRELRESRYDDRDWHAGPWKAVMSAPVAAVLGGR